MTDAEAKSKSNVFSPRRWVYLGPMMMLSLFLLSIAWKIRFDLPWFMVGIILFFGCVFVTLFICIDLILARSSSEAPMVALREALHNQFLILFMAATFTPGSFDNSSSTLTETIMSIVSILLLYVVLAGMTWKVIQCTRRVLKSDSDHLTTSIHPIEPSVEIDHQIVP